MNKGIQVDMTLAQMLTYTYVSTILGDLLLIKTPMGNWIYEGLIMSVYQRPLSIFGHIIAQTIGNCSVSLILFTIPMALISPLLGINITPNNIWVLGSLLLCISLGIALDFIFACVQIRLKNASWLIYSIRNAITLVLSGSVIPLAILPWGLGDYLIYQPFASLGGATLSIYTGLAEPIKIMIIQLIWNIILWLIAIVFFKKSQERMISHGG